jgi:hypothetical protein
MNGASFVLLAATALSSAEGGDAGGPDGAPGQRAWTERVATPQPPSAGREDALGLRAQFGDAGGLVTLPSTTAYPYGSLGPAWGTISRSDHATIGSRELLRDGDFMAAKPGWVLNGFSATRHRITHAGGTGAVAAQRVTMAAYRQHRLAVTLRTTARGSIAFTLAGVPLLDADIVRYPFDPGERRVYVFNVEFRSQPVTGDFEISTDLAWAGDIESVSLVEVADEVPFAFVALSHDDPNGRNPQGLKFGRFNAGQFFLGDRQTGAFHGADGTWNVGIGARALSSNETGFENTCVGTFCLKYTASSRNVAFGYSAGKLNTTGTSLTALGYKASFFNTTGDFNTSVGFHAAFQNTAGTQNTAVGYQALYQGLTDSYGTAIGSQAAYSLRGGDSNTSVGALAGFLNNDARALYTFRRTTSLGAETKVYGNEGLAAGWLARVGADGAPVDASSALGARAVSSGAEAVAVGARAHALASQTLAVGVDSAASGEQSTALGAFAESNGASSTAVGARAGTRQSGAQNTFVGAHAGDGGGANSFTNVTALGYASQATASNQVVLGDQRVSAIRASVSAITTLSDARDKADVNDLSLGLAFIESIRPVQFRWDRREWYDGGRRDGTRSDPKLEAGVIAQQLLEAQRAAGADWLGLVLEADPDRLEASPGKLLFPLLKAVQELSARVRTLEARAAACAAPSTVVAAERGEGLPTGAESRREHVRPAPGR